MLSGLALVARSLKGSLIFEPMTTPMTRTRYEGIQTLYLALSLLLGSNGLMVSFRVHSRAFRDDVAKARFISN